MRQHHTVDEFRVTVTTRSETAEVLIEIECQNGVDDSMVARQVGDHFASALGLRPSVNSVAPGALPDSS